MDKDKDMSRRRFLKMAALTGAAMCVGPTLNKVTAAERVWMGKQQVANNIPAGMAAVRTRRTLIGTRKYGIHCFCNGIWLYGLEP